MTGGTVVLRYSGFLHKGKSAGEGENLLSLF